MTLTAICGERMTMADFVRHIPKCPICGTWVLQNVKPTEKKEG
jgi:hypothetical protein